MKQGRASRDVFESSKREPAPKAKNVAKVADIGVQTIRTRPYTDKGTGFGPPPLRSMKTSKSGSQGKY